MTDENQVVDQNQVMRVFVEKPSKRDLALAIKQVLNDSGLTSDRLTELATSQVTEHVTRILDASLSAKKYDDLIVKALVTATNYDRESFLSARADGHFWHHYLKKLMEKALAESVLNSVDIKVGPKVVASPEPETEELDERTQAFNVLMAPGKAEMALRRQKLAKKLEDLVVAEKYMRRCEEELAKSLAAPAPSLSCVVQTRRIALSDAIAQHDAIVEEVIAAARATV